MLEGSVNVHIRGPDFEKLKQSLEEKNADYLNRKTIQTKQRRVRTILQTQDTLQVEPSDERQDSPDPVNQMSVTGSEGVKE